MKSSSNRLCSLCLLVMAITTSLLVMASMANAFVTTTTLPTPFKSSSSSTQRRRSTTLQAMTPPCLAACLEPATTTSVAVAVADSSSSFSSIWIAIDSTLQNMGGVVGLTVALMVLGLSAFLSSSSSSSEKEIEEWNETEFLQQGFRNRLSLEPTKEHPEAFQAFSEKLREVQRQPKKQPTNKSSSSATTTGTMMDRRGTIMALIGGAASLAAGDFLLNTAGNALSSSGFATAKSMASRFSPYAEKWLPMFQRLQKIKVEQGITATPELVEWVAQSQAAATQPALEAWVAAQRAMIQAGPIGAAAEEGIATVAAFSAAAAKASRQRAALSSIGFKVAGAEEGITTAATAAVTAVAAKKALEETADAERNGPEVELNNLTFDIVSDKLASGDASPDDAIERKLGTSIDLTSEEEDTNELDE